MVVPVELVLLQVHLWVLVEVTERAPAELKPEEAAGDEMGLRHSMLPLVKQRQGPAPLLVDRK